MAVSTNSPDEPDIHRADQVDLQHARPVSGFQIRKAGLGLQYKWVFLSFGLLGVAWAILVIRWFHDHPHKHPSVNAAELAHIGDSEHPGDHAMGCMNMVGQIGGAIAPLAVPFVRAATHNSWTVNIALFAAAYFSGAVC